MASLASQTQPTLTSKTALRLVLFGMPRAGKSSLLGALAQAAQIQEHLLKGQLKDIDQGLAELQRRVYDNEPRETLDEIVPYPIHFHPFGPEETRWEALLVDCDGRVVNQLLSRRQSLHDGKGDLVQAIRGADALILALDVSTPPGRMDADFEEFGKFLDHLEHSRGTRTEVGGLPVFLVLTKCDLLAEHGDSPKAWTERMEARKREVGRRFQEFLAHHRANQPMAFGSIHLEVWTAAVKTPALSDAPARPGEPYQVAELFRHALESARVFRRRQRASGRRLTWTVGGVAGVVALMLGLSTALYLTRPEVPNSKLARRIQNYRAREGPFPSTRLREPLQGKLSELEEFREDPEFPLLTGEYQDYVKDRLQELRDYRVFLDRLQHIDLNQAASEEDLGRFQGQLTHEPLIPLKDWAQTEAGFLHARLLKDLELLRLSMADAQGWFQKQAMEADRLRTPKDKPGNAREWRDWLANADEILSRPFPHVETETLPDSNFTYGRVLSFAGVEKSRKDWEEGRQRLRLVRDTAVLLGLAPPARQQALLDIPFGFRADQAGDRLREMNKLYPNWVKEIASANLPEALVSDVRAAAEKSYRHLIEAGQEAILQKLREDHPESQESSEMWAKLRRDWLLQAQELKDWRSLTNLLTPLLGLDAKEPVKVLEEFLARESFKVEIKALTLAIPFDRKVRPIGPLTLHHRRGAEAFTPLEFNLKEDEGKRDPQNRLTLYSFTRESPAVMDYRPGDIFWAELPVQREGEPGDWILTWARTRSAIYQFECLGRAPRLHRKEEKNTSGMLLEDVKLSWEGNVPKVPDLIPVVNLRK